MGCSGNRNRIAKIMRVSPNAIAIAAPFCLLFAYTERKAHLTQRNRASNDIVQYILEMYRKLTRIHNINNNNNNNNNNNKHDNVYGAVIVAKLLPEFTRFI